MSEAAPDMSVEPDQAEGGLDLARPDIGVGLGGACPTCRAPVELAQTYCLECGANTSRFPKKQQPRKGQAPVILNAPEAKRFPWIPLLILTALIVGGVIYLVVAGEQDKESNTPVDQTSGRVIEELEDEPAESPTGDEEETAFPQTGETDTVDDPALDAGDDGLTFPDESADAVAEGPAADDGTSTWPAGTDGYTIVLASYAKDTYQRSRADQRSVEAQSQGLDSGVIDSDEFASMSPGFWVVYSGVYESEAEADGGLAEVKQQGYPSAYVREVIPQ